jgi:hypothetical protein
LSNAGSKDTLDASVKDAAKEHYAQSPTQTSGAEIGSKTGVAVARTLTAVEHGVKSLWSDIQTRYAQAKEEVRLERDLKYFNILRDEIAQYGFENAVDIEYEKDGLAVKLCTSHDSSERRQYLLRTADASQAVSVYTQGKFSADEIAQAFELYAKVLAQDHAFAAKNKTTEMKNAITAEPFGTLEHECRDHDGRFDSTLSYAVKKRFGVIGVSRSFSFVSSDNYAPTSANAAQAPASEAQQ